MVGAIASGINSVAGGGSLISFPTLNIGLGLSKIVANATNSVGLWPGSLGGAIGFRNLVGKTQHHLKTLLLPTLLGSTAGSFLLLSTSERLFGQVIPWLILLAAILLLLQPKVKALLRRDERPLPVYAGIIIQFFVSVYGGYFGAGMGIMMLAAFALYMDGTVHEMNAVKNWLGTAINIACSAIFFWKGLVLPVPALILAAGAVVGGFLAAKFSQKVDPDKLRKVIAVYGLAMAVYFFWQSYGK